MAERKLSAAEVRALGLDDGPAAPSERPLSKEEVAALGLDSPTKAAPTSTAPSPSDENALMAWLRAKQGTIDKVGKYASDVGEGFAGNTRASLNSATMNALPRVRAAGDAIVQKLNGSPISLWREYDSALTERQTEAEKDAADHPSASIIGAFLTPPVGRGLTVAQRLVAAGGAGATSGFLRAPHDNPQAQREQALVGGTSGLLMQGANEAVAPVANLTSAALRRMAGENAANVAGGGRAQISDRMKKLGIAPEEVADFGNSLLDEGLIPTGLHPTQSPADGVLERSTALRERQGQAIGREISAADATGVGFDPIRAQEEMRSSVPNRNPLERDNSTKANRLIEQVGDLAPQGDYADVPRDSFATANQMKSQAWKAASFKDDVPMEAGQYRSAVGGLRNAIRDQVGEVNGPASADRLSLANHRFGIASDAHELSDNAVSRAGQASKFGLPAALMMLGGAGVGAAAGGAHGAGAGTGATAAALIGSALLKARGPAVAARSQRLGSELAAGVGRMSQNPAGAGAAGDALAKYLNPTIGSPEAVGNAALRLQKATGDLPEDKEDLAKKHFLADGGF